MSTYRTPLRYPGGKQKLAPFILEILETNDLCGGDYVEPYAGGAGVAIELLFGRHVRHIHLNDSCPGISSFWHAILDRTDEFCARISRASLTVEEWRRQQQIFNSPHSEDILDKGFSTFYLNRCNRSGILSGGLIGGINQDGPWKMDARFNRNELIRRIEVIATRRDQITITSDDAEDFIADSIPNLPANSLIYCDPPYFSKADRLYLNHYQPDDHARIANTIQNDITHPWVVSYDGADQILEHYAGRKSFLYDLQYSAANQNIGNEAFFFSDDLNIPEHSSISFINSALATAGI